MENVRLGPDLTEDEARSAGELLPDGLIVADENAVVVGANARSEQVTGLRVADITGRDIREAVPLQDGNGCSWWECTDPWGGLQTRTGHREKLLIVPGGPEVLVTAKYVRPGRNLPVIRVLSCFRDAEARRRADAEQAALLSTVAHELRSPLTSVKGFSSTLLKRWELFTDDQKRLMLETIEADADRVTRLITELLDVSRLDTGQLRVHALPVDLVGTIDRHVERFVAAGARRDVLTVDVHPDARVVWADPDRLDQILTNLIDNALKHGDGQVIVATQPGDEGRGAVDVVVSDDGPGIPPEKRDIVFSRFWQGGSRGSTGLGLYVVRGIAEAHGGRAVAEAGPNGARLRVSLPGEPAEA